MTVFYPFFKYFPRIERFLGTATYTGETTEGETTTPASLVITPTTTLSTTENGQRLAFIVTNSVPAEGSTLPATITINNQNIPIYDRFGNTVYGANLRNNVILKAYYGTDGANGTAHLILVNYPFVIR